MLDTNSLLGKYPGVVERGQRADWFLLLFFYYFGWATLIPVFRKVEEGSSIQF